MLVWRLLRRLSGSGRASQATPFDEPAERVIAQGRLLLCVLALGGLVLDPAQPAGAASAEFLVAYAALGAALLGLTFLRTPGPAAQVAIHLTDIAAVSMLLSTAGALTGPLFVFFIFILLAATLRWRARGVVATAAVLALVLSAVPHNAVPAPSDPANELNRALVTAVCLLVIGGMLVYAAAYRDRIRERLERARVTRDLHDGVLQSLTAAALQLKLAEKEPAGKVRTRLALVRQLIAKEQTRIREFVEGVPATSDKAGEIVLARELQKPLSESARHWGCSASFSVVPESATMPRALEGNLSLMLSEAVANAVRHGGASKVDVSVEQMNGDFVVKVRDNGAGFPPWQGPQERDTAELAYASTIPASLHGRIGELGGTLEVSSSPRGTELNIRIPLS